MELQILAELIHAKVNAKVDTMLTNSGIITLGELEARLQAVEPVAPVMFDNGTYPGELTSYRGYYRFIAIEPCKGYCNAGDLLERVTPAIGKTFTGYKGGEFKMSRMTPVWVSAYGIASRQGLVGVELKNGVVILKTGTIGI